jgi:hypothetical protein
MSIANKFRRTVVPIVEKPVEKWLDRDIICKRAQDFTYVGVIRGRSVDTVAAEISSREKHYPVNLAALKWRESTHSGYQKDGDKFIGPDSEVVDSLPRKHRVYERGSFAYRPDGWAGKYQYHVRLFPHERGTAVWAHYEINPWYDPKAHYAGVDWMPKKGRDWAVANFDIDTTVSKDGVVEPKHNN